MQKKKNIIGAIILALLLAHHCPLCKLGAGVGGSVRSGGNGVKRVGWWQRVVVKGDILLYSNIDLPDPRQNHQHNTRRVYFNKKRAHVTLEMKCCHQHRITVVQRCWIIRIKHQYTNYMI